ncbi:MAG TPA: SCO family protein [Flavitalea sp.]|nr:SCO family protein [Flavitalea sp.]
MKAKLTIWIFGIMVFVIPFGAFAFYMFYEKNFERLPIYGKVESLDGKKKYHTIPDFELTNQGGNSISTKDWMGKIVIANFFFTHCPVVCPKMTGSLKSVQYAFREDGSDILINSFSIDPERDNPGRLRSYAEKFSINNHNWQLLTGDKSEIYKLARNGFMIVATDGDGGPEDFIHSEKLVLIDKQKRIRGYYDGTNLKEVNNLIHDIKKLRHEN